MAYANEIWTGKKKLEPSILDLEKRIPIIKKEIQTLANEIRKLEIEEIE